MLVDRDMGVLQPDLTIADDGVGTAQVDLAITNRLDLGSHQRDARLNRALNGIVMVRLPVDRYDLGVLLLSLFFLFGCACFRHASSSSSTQVVTLPANKQAGTLWSLST